MAGLMDGLSAEAYDRQYSDRVLYQRILERLAPQRTNLLQLGILVTLQSLAAGGVPILISKTLDLLKEDETSGSLLLGAVFLTMGLGATDWLLNYRNQALAARTIGVMVQDLRQDTFDATLRRDMRFFDQNIPGKLISRITSDTQELGALVTLFSGLMSSLLLVALMVGVMFYRNASLAALSLATAPLLWLSSVVFRRLARARSTGSRRILGTLNGMISESISGISVAKGFRQEQGLFDAFADTNLQGYRVNLQLGWTFNTIFPVLNLLLGVGTAVVIYFGGRAALQPELSGVTPGEWFFFVQATGTIFFPLTSLASFFSQLQSGLASGACVCPAGWRNRAQEGSSGHRPGTAHGGFTL